MWKYTVAIDGMMCNMCEAHMNDTIRKHYDVKKVTSSHTKKETVFITEDNITEESLNRVISDLGYTMGAVRKEEAKKGLLGWK